MFDPVTYDLDRHLSSIESAERLSESAIDWVLGGSAEDYFDEDEWPDIKRIADDGPLDYADQLKWDDVMDRFLDAHSPY